MFENKSLESKSLEFICPMFDYPTLEKVNQELTKATKGNPRTRLLRLIDTLDMNLSEGKVVYDRANQQIKALSKHICLELGKLNAISGLDPDLDQDEILDIINHVVPKKIEDSLMSDQDVKELDRLYRHLNFLISVFEQWTVSIQPGIMALLPDKLDSIQQAEPIDQPGGNLKRRTLALLLIAFRQNGLIDKDLSNVSLARTMETFGFSMVKSIQELSLVSSMDKQERSTVSKELKELLNKVESYLDEIS